MVGFANGKLVKGCFTVLGLSNSYTMVFSPARVDNPLALASGLSRTVDKPWYNYPIPPALALKAPRKNASENVVC